MADTQGLTLALSMVIPIAMLIDSNSRVNEAALRPEAALGNARLLSEIRKIKSLLKQHQLEHH